MAKNERLPPQNIQAEQSVMGSMLIDNEAIARVVEILKPESFYKEAHNLIYEAIVALFNRGQPVDIVTVSEELTATKKLEAVGGRIYLTELAESVPTSANVEYYAQIVEDKHVLRQLIHAGSGMVEKSMSDDGEINQILEQTEKAIFDITQRKIRQGFVPVKDVLDTVMEDIEKSYEFEGSFSGIPSGFSDLDALTGGFQQADLVILAARPSMGKTALALNIAQNASSKYQVPVAIFSLEMSKESLTRRLICSEAAIDSSKLKSKNLQDHEWKRLAKALGKLSESPIYVDDTPSISTVELRAKVRRLKVEKHVGLVIIDFLQLLGSSYSRRKYENRTQEVSENIRTIKAIAREMNVPVICLSQLSRAVEQRQSQIPRLSDLRESGEIEQVADVVLFIHREDYYERTPDAGNIAEIIIAKQRNGPTGTIELAFRREITKFEPLIRRVPDL